MNKIINKINIELLDVSPADGFELLEGPPSNGF